MNQIEPGRLEGISDRISQGSGWSVLSDATLDGRPVVLKKQVRELERHAREREVLDSSFPNVIRCLGAVGEDTVVLELLAAPPQDLPRVLAQGYVNDLMVAARALFLNGYTWVAMLKHIGIASDGSIRIFDFNDDDLKRELFFDPNPCRLDVCTLIRELCDMWGLNQEEAIKEAFFNMAKMEYQELRNNHDPIFFAKDHPEYAGLLRRTDEGALIPANRKCVDRWGMIEPALAGTEGGSALDIGCDIGWFSFAMAEFGLNAVGVDASEEKVMFAKMMGERFESPATMTYSMVDEVYVEGMPDYDVVLALSVLHWHLYNAPAGTTQVSIGMGRERFEKFFSRLCSKARKVFVLEMPVRAMEILGAGNAQKLGEFAIRHGGFVRYEVIGTSTDAKRPLIACFR